MIIFVGVLVAFFVVDVISGDIDFQFLKICVRALDEIRLLAWIFEVEHSIEMFQVKYVEILEERWNS